MREVRYIDLFAGAGGIRVGFEQALQEMGYRGRCVLTSEIKASAKKVYEENFGDEEITGDITKVKAEDIEDFDYLLGGFPCQAFSLAGNRRGFEDTRGTLFFEIARILDRKRPRGFILENVEGLILHDRTAEQRKKGEMGRTLRIMLDILDEMGYKVSYKVLEGTDFGVPQKRRRIFIVGHLEKEVDLENLEKQEIKYIKDITETIGYDKECEFNKVVKEYLEGIGEGIEYLAGKQIKDVRGGENNISGWDLGVRGKVTKEEKAILDYIRDTRRLKSNKETKGLAHKDAVGLFQREINEGLGYNTEKEVESLKEKGYLVDKEVEGHTVIDLKGSRLSYKYTKILDPEGFSNTLVATDARANAVIDSGGLRGLTKRELLRLNGFPEEYTMESVSRNQALDLMGNTVVVPIIKEIGKEILKEG